MIRVYLIYILFILVCNTGQSQGLSVELSVEWRRTEYQLRIPPIKSDTSIIIPILKLVYRNLSGEDIYFRNVNNSGSMYPNVVWASLDNTLMDLADRAKIHNSFEGQSYKVEIGRAWEVIKPSIDFWSEHEPDIINDELFEIYEVLRTQQVLNDLGINKQLSCFDGHGKEILNYMEAQRLIAEKGILSIGFQDIGNSGLAEDEIYRKYSDEFVFLKSWETYTQEIDLIGFYLLGGSFEFLITDTFLPDYIVGKNQQKISLPKIVNCYKLYEGVFLTNTVGVKIN